MSIFQRSISATVLITAVAILRAFVLHKLPKKTFLCLWGIVIGRLLLPFSIPSRFSFYTVMVILKRVLKKTTIITLPNAIGNTNRAIIIDVRQPMEISQSTVSFSTIKIVWLAGMCACALFFIVTYIKCYKEFQTSLPIDNDFVSHWLREYPIWRSVQIRQCDKIEVPLTYGVLRPVVLMPKTTDWTDETSLRYILTHEFVHIKRFDTLTKLLLTTALCIHWFNPFVWSMYILANRDIELSCDETVVQNFGETAKSTYAMMLIEMEEGKNKLTPLCNNFCKNAIEERIVAIMKMKKTSLIGIMLALAIVIGTIMVFATSANVTAAEFDRQLNENAKGSIMSYHDEEKEKTFYSWDDGVTWTPLTDEEYETKFPTANIEWWTYNEYKAWLDNEKVELQDIIGERGWNPTEGWNVWTQARVDETVKLYEENLRDLKDGKMLSKSVDGDENIVMSYDPKDIEKGSHEYSIYILLDNGEEITFGPYKTKEQIYNEVKAFCDEQVKAGNMGQKEAGEILIRYQ